jgi:hypothetical protein
MGIGGGDIMLTVLTLLTGLTLSWAAANARGAGLNSHSYAHTDNFAPPLTVSIDITYIVDLQRVTYYYFTQIFRQITGKNALSSMPCPPIAPHPVRGAPLGRTYVPP